LTDWLTDRLNATHIQHHIYPTQQCSGGGGLATVTVSDHYYLVSFSLSLSFFLIIIIHI
jgi:hypothetical protein